MARYGLIGHKIAHSISPALHRCAFRQFGIEEQYEIIDVPPGELEDNMGRIRDMRGANITIPHKRDILRHLDEIDTAASEIGAVNTILVENGRVRGMNTDWTGIMRSLESRRISSALILGAGGAARAAIYALQQRGIDVTISNRTAERARALAQEFSCRMVQDASDASADLLINATPVGTDDETPLAAEHLRRFKIVFDMVYSPKETRLLKEAAEHGCERIQGLLMLVHQAAESFFIWTGHRPDIDMMRQRAEEELS